MDKKILETVKAENAKALNKILRDENARLKEEIALLMKIKSVQDEALKVAEGIIAEIRGQ